jgi:hypothetical protein
MLYLRLHGRKSSCASLWLHILSCSPRSVDRITFRLLHRYNMKVLSSVAVTLQFTVTLGQYESKHDRGPAKDPFHALQGCGRSSPCASPELCYDFVAGRLLAETVPDYVVGMCFGRQCSGSSSDCRIDQACVRTDGKAARCLFRDVLRCGAGQQCPKDWDCIRDPSDPKALGYCGPAKLG